MTKFRKIASTILVLVFVLSLSGCTVMFSAGSNDLPPGQEKKLNGDKSAREYAPGQEKK